MAIKVLQ